MSQNPPGFRSLSLIHVISSAMGEGISAGAPGDYPGRKSLRFCL